MEKVLENWKSNIAIALIAASSATTGSYLTGHYLIKSNAQQIQVEQSRFKTELKIKYIENLIKLSSEYGQALEGLINTGLTDPGNEKELISYVSSVQLKGTELMLVTDDEIAHVVNSVNYYAASFLKNRNTEKSQEYLNKLGTINVMLMKSLRSLIQANYDFVLKLPNKSKHSDSANAAGV